MCKELHGEERVVRGGQERPSGSGICGGRRSRILVASSRTSRIRFFPGETVGPAPFIGFNQMGIQPLLIKALI